MRFAIMLFMLLFPTMVFAQEVPVEDWIPMVQAIFSAVTEGQWWAAVAATLSLTSFVLRRHGGKIWAPLGTVAGVIATTFVLSFAGGLANSLAAGAAVTLEVVLTALKIGFTAAGGWGAVELIIKLITTKDPEDGDAVA